ncbi:MAG: ABC transporter transmembrane domain-containing protein [Pseudomonadota bacterium]
MKKLLNSETVVLSTKMSLPVLVASLLSNLLALAMPLVILQVFDRVIPFEAYATLTVLFIGLCTVALIDFFLKWARLILLGHEGQRYELELGSNFLRRSLEANPSAYDRFSTGAHLEKLNALSHLRDHFCGPARLYAVDTPFTAIFIIMIALIGGWLVLVPLTAISMLYAFKVLLKKTQGPVFEARKTLDGRRYSFLIECLSQIMTVKSDTMEPQLRRRYEALQNQSVNISQKLLQFTGYSQAFGAVFSQGTVAAMALAGSYLVIAGKIGVAELAACMLLNGRTVQPLLKMLGHWAQTESIQVARQKVEEIASLEQRARVAPPDQIVAGSLTFDRVTARHEENDRTVLSHVSFEVQAGRAVLLEAENAICLETMMRLILHEQKPKAGQIFFSGLDMERMQASRGHGGIVYVSQEPAIFSGSILENITCFGQVADVSNALSTALEIGLEDAVHRMPMGYETILGGVEERHIGLSLLQQIALTRALALKPRLLLMNDPTSALDRNEHILVANCLAKLKGQATIVMATPSRFIRPLADQSFTIADPVLRQTRNWTSDALADEQMERIA